MKKLLIGAGALAAFAFIGFGSLNAPATHANPAKIWIVNSHVANFLNPAGTAAVLTPAAALTATDIANLDSYATGSAGQITVGAPIPAGAVTNAGDVYIIVQTDGSGTNVTLNGRGLTCAPVLCDSAAVAVPDATNHLVVYQVTSTGTHVAADTFVVTATQDAVTLDSASITIVGQAHDVTLATTKTSVQEASPSCTLLSSITDPTRGGAGLTYTDINGKALVGYQPLWTSSAISKMTVASTAAIAAPQLNTSYAKDASSAPLAPAVFCGVAAGTANLNAQALANQLAGQTSAVTRTAAITITGVPAAIALTASPATVACDGVNSSTVAAKVTDSAGNNVADNTPVIFSVVALGTANPVNGVTTNGLSSTTVTPLSTATQGVTVSVTSGAVTSQILVSCSLSALVTQVVATATAAGGGTITPPNTGTGGYLGQESSGFPMWTLLALGLGSVALIGGGIVAKRSR